MGEKTDRIFFLFFLVDMYIDQIDNVLYEGEPGEESMRDWNGEILSMVMKHMEKIVCVCQR